MLAATSRNVVVGLECVGPLKVVDTVTTTRLDISSGTLTLPDGPGIGLTLDEAKLEKYRFTIGAVERVIPGNRPKSHDDVELNDHSVFM